MCAAMAADKDRGFFGHPVGLRTLFFTEMWERFSYYGMRAFLFIYMTAQVTDGGRGMTVTTAGSVMAVFLSSVYLLSLPGGWIADRFLGQRKAVTFGGIGIAAGNALLALPSSSLIAGVDPFYPGLALIALGTGLLKPNISTIVGQLYSKDDVRRDSGFTIYYMGINIGATVSPFVCGYLAQSAGFKAFLLSHDLDPTLCWHFGFAAASVGMIGGLIQYAFGQGWLGDAGKHPTIPSEPERAARDRTVLMAILGALVAVLAVVVLVQPSEDVTVNSMGIGLALGSIALFFGLFYSARDAGERRRVIAMIPLFIGAIGFFGIFEQASTTLSDFAEKLTERQFLGLDIPASYYQSVNGFFIVLLAPVFAFAWLKLAKAKKEPSSVTKFGIGMVVLALSFVVMLPTLSSVMKTPPDKVSAGYLMMLYFLYTCSELFISPVGLSSMSKLAPKRLAGMVMGTWFLAAANGNYLAGRAAGLTESRGYNFLFIFLIVVSLLMAAGLFVVAPMIRRMMAVEGNDHASGPADKSEKTEPEPLPEARAIPKD
jgi:POT family proton-dependent oligopeptide transporter